MKKSYSIKFKIWFSIGIVVAGYVLSVFVGAVMSAGM